jgi:hypothetical protein
MTKATRKKSGLSTDSVYNDMLEIMMRSAADLSMAISPYNDCSKSIKVVPVPSLALQWLINANGWPLGYITSCSGNLNTYKSTFTHQLMAWFIHAGGVSNLIDTEGQSSWENLAAMIDESELSNKELAKRCVISSAQTMEQWQGLLQKQADYLKDKYTTPTNCPIPCLNVVDSLSGVDSRSYKNELTTNGSSCEQLSTKSLHRFVRYGARQLMISSDQPAERWPMTLHLINHQGDGSRSGDFSQHLHTSLDLGFTIGGSSSYNAAASRTPGCGHEGWIITIKVRFSAMGPDGDKQAISVPVLVKYARNEKTGKNQRFIMYDWGAADAHFLCLKHDQISKIFPLEVECVHGRGKYMKSELLGMDGFFSASVFGLLLQSNHKVMQLLRNELGIATRDIFTCKKSQ